MSSKVSTSMPSKPIIIGLFGVSGSGKTHLLGELKRHFESGDFMFFEGSVAIAAHVDGGLEAFKKLDRDGQMEVRDQVIRSIAMRCKTSGKAGIVTGHVMLRDEGVLTSDNIRSVLGPADWDVYTHIIYLDVEPHLIANRRKGDVLHGTRERPEMAVRDIMDWQAGEKDMLVNHCLKVEDLLLAIVNGEDLCSRAIELVAASNSHSEAAELAVAIDELDTAFQERAKDIDTVFVFDADKTLAPQDTGNLYWECRQSTSRPSPYDVSMTVTNVFRAHGYTDHAFRQVALLYEGDGAAFNDLCDAVAARVTLYPEMKALLVKLSQEKHLGVCVVTCGLAAVWRKVLAGAGLPDVPVLGSGRFDEELVITPTVKAKLVACLQDKYRKFVVAVGDSPIDLPMLRQAEQAVVVAGPPDTRSKSMPDHLLAAINDGLRPSQVVLGGDGANPILPTEIPVITLADLDLSLTRWAPLRFSHATSKPAAQLLMTATRDARIAGPALRDAHSLVGAYLAREYLAGEMGLEETAIPHTTGGTTTGWQVRGEASTVIVPLMRGGLPMAQGVNDALPQAALVPARAPADLQPLQLRARAAVVLVDSVVNSGASMVEFVARVRALDAFVPIFVVAGVVQAGAVAKGGPLHRASARYGGVSVVALRVSENAYKGVGGTDTGNRLFNTTYLD